MDNEEKDINPHDLIRKHIQNKDHKITDEELAKVKIGEDAIPKDELKKDAEHMEEEFKHTDHPPNPYDVI